MSEEWSAEAEEIAVPVDGATAVPELLGKATAPAASTQRGWFTRLVQYYLKRRYAKGAPPDAITLDPRVETERAQSVIRRACVKSALTGAIAGSVSTGATVLTAETEGLAAVVTIPVAAITIGGEMLYRSLVHLDMCCDLADIFDVKINPDDPKDFWRIYAMAFHAEEHDASGDPGKGLVERIVHVEGHEVGETIGSRLVGESVMRNVIPFVGIASSSIGNWRMTRRVGDIVRRYYRYQRALHDVFVHAEAACRPHIDLLVEGLWFIFTADGKLNAEEAAVLGGILDRLDPLMRQQLLSRFTEDEYDWAERLRGLNGKDSEARALMHALEVAAAVDKSVSLPERKILHRAARKMGLVFDPAKVEEMIKRFDEVGVLDSIVVVASG